MILTLFWALFLISLALIALGLIYSKEWGGVGIVGFTFLFLLSLTIVQGEIEIQKGSTVNTTYTYDSNLTVAAASQNIEYNYNFWSDSTSHTIGYFLAIISAAGAFACIINLRGNWKTGR